MKLSLLSAVATTFALATARAVPAPVTRTDTDPTHGQIELPTPYTHIAPGAAFDFAYLPSADYCRSTFAYSVWLITDVPSSFAPMDVFAAGTFFGRFDFPNYPAVPEPKNPAPPQLTMPDFSKSAGGFASTQTASNKTVQLVVLEEWSGCDLDVRLLPRRSPCPQLHLSARLSRGAPLTTRADVVLCHVQAPLGMSMSLTYVPVIYNATTSA
ncbi:hypothetical protein C2E23DRAFT_744291 [Lenzites betulinus]|nr:hypothetical protein C2E23DRAFT_744291 [Lenzites betulinus]